MDWRQAVRYCQWLTETKRDEFPEGFEYACLPTEAEWEYACRAGTETDYYSGDGDAALDQVGWYEENSAGSTRPVRTKESNRFDLYDMHGNVWEWTHDVWDDAAYRKRIPGDRDPGANARLNDLRDGMSDTLTSSQDCVLRGGSWFFTAGDCRSACRDGRRPGGRSWSRGFRVCLVRGPEK